MPLRAGRAAAEENLDGTTYVVETTSTMQITRFGETIEIEAPA